MAQPNCDVVKIAEDYVRTHLSFIGTANRRWSSSIEGNVWTVRLELPEGALGFVPEIGVDPRTCQVVSAKVWQWESSAREKRAMHDSIHNISFGSLMQMSCAAAADGSHRSIFLESGAQRLASLANVPIL